MFTKNQLKTILLSSLGGGLEYYDFIIFAIFSAYLSQAFFPTASESGGLLATFVVFGVGYLIRPIGGVILSHFGDTRGRKTSFTFSITLMALSTLAIGLLPTYDSWGYVATVLFVLLRLLQGLSIGGELPGAMTFVFEQGHTRPATACSIIFACLNLGSLLAYSLNSLLLSTLGEAGVQAYGWRIAFVFGGSLGIVGYWMRRSLLETPLYEQVKSKASIPLLKIWRDYRQQLFFATLGCMCGAVLVVMNSVYFVAFTTKGLHYSAAEAAKMSMIYHLGYTFFIPFYGVLADRVGIKRLFFAGLFFYLGYGALYYYALANHAESLGLLTLLFSLAVGMSTTAFPILALKLFPTEVRYTGIATSYNISFALLAGFMPAVASAWLVYSPNNFIPYWISSVPILVALAVMLPRQKRLDAMTLVS